MKISEISKLTDVPASTICHYERFGFISPVARLTNGYRDFGERHAAQIKICRLVFREFVNRKIRAASRQVIAASACWNIPLCQQYADEYLSLIGQEISKVRAALETVYRWELSVRSPKTKFIYNAAQSAKIVGVTKDTIRGWERNGLFGRFPARYEKRKYGTDDIARMQIIYLLLRTGYSTAVIHRYLTMHDDGDPQASEVLTDGGKYVDLQDIFLHWLQLLQNAEKHANEILLTLQTLSLYTTFS